MKPKLNSDQQLALKWACGARTIRRWRKDGAPLSNPARMRQWLAGRTNIPPGTAALLMQARTSEAAQSAGFDEKLVEGAAAALRRLESAEARAYSAFRRACESGDGVAIKAKREDWLRISESLRRYDLALELTRRDAGTLVERSEAERVIGGFVFIFERALRGGFERAAPSMAGLQTEQLWATFNRLWLASLSNAMAAVKAWPCDRAEIPKWATAAAEKAIGQHAGILNIGEIADAKEKLLRECFKHFCEVSVEKEVL